jgi:hypothetical protein
MSTAMVGADRDVDRGPIAPHEQWAAFVIHLEFRSMFWISFHPRKTGFMDALHKLNLGNCSSYKSITGIRMLFYF